MPTAHLNTPMQSSIEREHEEESSRGSKSGGSSGVRGRLGRVFSPKTFLVDLVVAFVGIGLLSAVVGAIPIPFFGSIGGLFGLLAATFLVGTLRSRRQYVEVTLAGAAATALAVFLATLTTGFFAVGLSLLEQYGVVLTAGGALVGAVVSLVGYYFGRDLRDGLTQEL